MARPIPLPSRLCCHALEEVFITNRQLERQEQRPFGYVYYQAVTGEARTTPFRVTTAQTSLRRRERTPAAKSCPAVSSPLPLNPLEIYCHALSRRPPCRRVEESLYEEKAFTAGSTGRGGSSARAVVVTALVTGRRTGLRPSILMSDQIARVFGTVVKYLSLIHI